MSDPSWWCGDCLNYTDTPVHHYVCLAEDTPEWLPKDYAAQMDVDDKKRELYEDTLHRLWGDHDENWTK